MDALLYLPMGILITAVLFWCVCAGFVWAFIVLPCCAVWRKEQEVKRMREDMAARGQFLNGRDNQ